MDEDELIAELPRYGPDHPSPVSVLDGSVYRDDVLSPVKLISNAAKGIVFALQITEKKSRAGSFLMTMLHIESNEIVHSCFVNQSESRLQFYI